MLSPAQWGQIATVGVIVGACLVLAVRTVDREDPYRTHEWEEAEEPSESERFPKLELANTTPSLQCTDDELVA